MTRTHSSTRLARIGIGVFRIADMFSGSDDVASRIKGVNDLTGWVFRPQTNHGALSELHLGIYFTVIPQHKRGAVG